MGFWDVIDRVVGYIPVIGTVKDTIEAGIEEAQGHHAEAKEKLLEAGFSIVSDIVTVATLGTIAKVAIAGKMAAGKALKQAAEGALKTAEEATSLGLGKKAAVVVTAAAAFVVTAAAAAHAAKGDASKRNKRQAASKPTSQGLTEPPEKRKKPSSNNTTGTDASASPVLKEPLKKPKEPKRGHHVINNGVKRIFQDIIEKFFQEHKDRIFLGKTYEDLVNDGVINKKETPNLMRSHDQLLPSDVSAQIETMVAYTPTEETHTDANDMRFGISKVVLSYAVTQIIFYVCTFPEEAGGMPDPSEGFRHVMESMIAIIAFINGKLTERGDVYVDNQALKWWLANKGEMAQFTRCRDNVRDMFNSLADVRQTPDERIACIWGREIFDVYSKVTQRHDLTSLPLPSTYNPVAFVRSPGQPPDYTIKPGYQNDEVGEIYSAVAITNWGLIPGKAKGYTCWFPYGGKEHYTKNFVWLTSMRPVKRKKNEGSLPRLAIECGFQEKEAEYLYAAIAQTEWGEIPGKAKIDLTCWYSYDGGEHNAPEFYWLVRGTPE